MLQMLRGNLEEISVCLLAVARLNVTALLLLKLLVLIVRGPLVAVSVVVTRAVTRRRFCAAVITVAT